MRCFVAVDLGSQALEEILAFQRVLVDTGADLKLVEAENIHITLRFLGDTSLSLVDKIGGELRTLGFAPFEVSIRGVGVFPNIKRINVIWAGIEEGTLSLVDVHGRVEAQLRKLSISPDGRGFSPHITIARVRSARNKDRLGETVLAAQNKMFGSFTVDSVKLKKSILTPKGPIYTTLAEAKATEK